MPMGKRRSETLTHPVFGKVRWEQQYGWWFAQGRDSTGEWLAVRIDAEEADRLAAIDPAAKLYRRAIRSERRIIKDAIRDKVLELYNDTWRGDDFKLTA